MGNNRQQVTLRDATENDVAFLCGVYASTRTEELALTDWDDGQKAEFCRMQFTAQDAHYKTYYPTARYHVIECDGEPIGRLYVDRWEREIRIMDIALLTGWRRRGIGSRLLEDLQTEGEASGKALSIHVEKFNPALQWYERLGFQAVEDKNVYWLMRWEA
jgi:ribosomal protein S18 acetylase RimI-like enzyme